MKKILHLFTATCGLSLTAFAFDFGGTLSNDTQFYRGSADDINSLKQVDTLSVYFRTPFNEAGSMYLAAEGNVAPTYTIEDLSESSDTDEFICPIDIALLKFSDIIKLDAKTSFQISAGRFTISDATGLIVNQIADGLSFAANTQRLNFNAYGGYTGLLNGHNTTMIAGDVEDSDNDYYYLASPFVLASASAYAPYLFLNQSIGLELYATIGLKGSNGDNKDLNRYYATLSLNGPLAQNLFYTLSSTLEFMTSPEDSDLDLSKFANLSKLSVSYYIPEQYNLALSANVVYASAKQGPFEAFSGFTSIDICNSYAAPTYDGASGSLKMGLSASVKPIEKLFAMLSADLVMISKDGDTADDDQKLEYNGFQILANAKYQLFTDLQIGLTMYNYFADEDDNKKFSATLNAVLSF